MFSYESRKEKGFQVVNNSFAKEKSVYCVDRAVLRLPSPDISTLHVKGTRREPGPGDTKQGTLRSHWYKLKEAPTLIWL